MSGINALRQGKGRRCGAVDGVGIFINFRSFDEDEKFQIDN